MLSGFEIFKFFVSDHLKEDYGLKSENVHVQHVAILDIITRIDF